MTYLDKLRAIKRVRAISWEMKEEFPSKSEDEEFVALLMEYFQNMARFLRFYRCPIEKTHTPFFDVVPIHARYFPPHYSLPPGELPLGLTRKVCEWYISLEELWWSPERLQTLEHGVCYVDVVPKGEMNINVYEPLILIFEKFGSLSTEHGFIHTPRCGAIQIESSWKYIKKKVEEEEDNGKSS